jgi:hypothetical protein
MLFRLILELNRPEMDKDVGDKAFVSALINLWRDFTISF